MGIIHTRPKSLLSTMKCLVFKTPVITLLFFCLYSCQKAVINAQTNAVQTNIAQFVYTSDLHYGISRTFQGVDNVSGQKVNEAMVKQMNTLPTVIFPNDGGVNAGKTVGSIDYLVITGDITNRQEIGIQSATASWAQFDADYLSGGITLKNKNNQKIPFLLTCGNHDASNAIGFTKAMSPLIDATSMVNIYNLMLNPSTPKTNSTYNYHTDKINYSKDTVGVHLMFINMWPDSVARIWMEKDLDNVTTTTPVIIFTHDPPIGDPKHFTNPNGAQTINSIDKFENLLEEVMKDGTTTKASTTIEQKDFVAFLKAHTNIKAYFHGHDNNNEFYTYYGPSNDMNLQVYRVDSPMKGDVSGLGAGDGVGDETKLSFQVISIDGDTKMLTVRECLWNTSGVNSKLNWGVSSTISLK